MLSDKQPDGGQGVPLPGGQIRPLQRRKFLPERILIIGFPVCQLAGELVHFQHVPFGKLGEERLRVPVERLRQSRRRHFRVSPIGFQGFIEQRLIIIGPVGKEVRILLGVPLRRRRVPADAHHLPEAEGRGNTVRSRCHVDMGQQYLTGFTTAGGKEHQFCLVVGLISHKRVLRIQRRLRVLPQTGQIGQRHVLPIQRPGLVAVQQRQDKPHGVVRPALGQDGGQLHAVYGVAADIFLPRIIHLPLYVGVDGFLQLHPGLLLPPEYGIDKVGRSKTVDPRQPAVRVQFFKI